jgi:hypothetical protein
MESCFIAKKGAPLYFCKTPKKKTKKNKKKKKKFNLPPLVSILIKRESLARPIKVSLKLSILHRIIPSYHPIANCFGE